VSFGIEYFYYSDLQLPKSLSNSIIGMFLFYLIYSLVDFGQNNGGKSFTLWDIIAWLGAVSSIAIFYIDADWIALSNALVYFGLLRMMYKTILLASKHRFQPRIIYFILMLSFLPFFLVSTYYIFIDSKFTYIYEVATTFQVLILMALVVYKRSKLEEQYFENELNRLRESFYREPKNTDEKYKSSKYSEQEVEKCYETVVARLKTDKLYLDPELNMLKLSQELGFPSHLLSQAINQKEGKNFFDFINTYRVEEAKSMLSNLKFNHHSVEGIGYECGFNTKATFYSTFKKQTGETPAEYKKRHQKL
jgi:AraC-like DNA-binding protein